MTTYWRAFITASVGILTGMVVVQIHDGIGNAIACAVFGTLISRLCFWVERKA